MRLFILGFLIVVSNSLYSQKTYSFDYLLEYELKIKEGMPIQKEYFYINSKDNSYRMHVVEKDALSFTVDFLDVSGNHAVMFLSKSDFFKAKSITVPCEFIRYYSNKYLRYKDYVFSSLNDTVINGVSYYHYVLKSKSIHRESRKKLSRAHYITDKESSFNLPFFFRVLDLEVWKRDRSVLNGIPFIEFLVYPVNKKVSDIRNLVKRERVSMQLLVPDECDYEKMRKNLSTIRIKRSTQYQ